MNISPTILYEDNDLIVVDKPAGMIVNRADTARDVVTLQDWISEKLQIDTSKLKKIETSEFENRGGIVHRLDKETSGLLIIAKNEKSFENLQSQFKERIVKKKYIALVHEEVEAAGMIDGKIKRVGGFGKFGVDEVEGRESQTEYKLENKFILSEDMLDQIVLKNDVSVSKNKKRYFAQHAKYYSLVSVFPKTGRTHQIRVHMKSIGAPLVSDLIYGPKKLLKLDLLWCPRLFLHAAEISFVHPATREKLNYKSKLPDDLRNSLNTLLSI